MGFDLTCVFEWAKLSVKKSFEVVLITSFYYSTLGIRKFGSATSWKSQPLLNTRQYVSPMSQRCCSHLGTSCNASLVYQVDQSQDAICYVATTSGIGQFYLSNSEDLKTSFNVVMMTSQHAPKCPDLYEAEMRRYYDISCSVSTHMINKIWDTRLTKINKLLESFWFAKWPLMQWSTIYHWKI